MNDLRTLLYSLNNKPNLIHPCYLNSITEKLTKYINGEIEPDDDYEKEDFCKIVEGGIAVIPINGIIAKRVGLPQLILDFLGIVDLDYVDRELVDAANNDDIKAIILDINSPGGFISGVQSTAEIINDISTQKEIVVYSDLLNASAAYWLSSQANSINVKADAEIGSVGVYLTTEDWSKYLDQNGIKINLLRAGKYKAIGLPSQPLTDEQRAYLQKDVDELHTIFKNEIKKKRKVMDDHMEGQTFNGKQAVEYGLADYLVKNINEVITALQ